jgi:ankyrin repeat protein
VKRFLSLAAIAVCVALGTGRVSVSAQNQAARRVDYQRDVQPILQQNCSGCHGAKQQIAGFRADRRSSVFAARRVVPGGLENSLLFHRLIGDVAYGPQMPPTGAIPQAQIDTIKTWIQEGAEWPDLLANEADLPPTDPKAIAVVEALRAGDRGPLMTADAALLNGRGPEGSSPFMYAVLYTDASTIEALLSRGGNAKAHNDANATPLMWAASDLAKTRALVEHGADVNVLSDDARTALMIAATTQGQAPTVKFLLDHGANPNPTPAPGGMSSPLILAATAADPELLRLLVAAGANVKASATQGISMSIATRCKACLDIFMANDIDPKALTDSLLETAYLIDTPTAKLLLDRGADVNGKGSVRQDATHVRGCLRPVAA